VSRDEGAGTEAAHRRVPACGGSQRVRPRVKVDGLTQAPRIGGKGISNLPGTFPSPVVFCDCLDLQEQER
jgi:hypothetical protein